MSVKWYERMRRVLSDRRQQSQETRTLLLSYPTILTAPRFFSVLALVLRASGHDIVVMAPRSEEALGAKSLEVPYTEWLYPVASRLGKLEYAEHYAGRGKTIWIDTDFAGWPKGLPDPTRVQNLVILNWAAYLGRKGPSNVALG